MSRKYRNPPLIEAVCEFQFDPKSEWDIAIPVTPIPLEDYFQFYPYLGPEMPQQIGPFMMGVQIAYDSRDALRVQLANAPAERPDYSDVILELDYSLTNPQGIQLDDASG